MLITFIKKYNKPNLIVIIKAINTNNLINEKNLNSKYFCLTNMLLTVVNKLVIKLVYNTLLLTFMLVKCYKRQKN